MPVSLWRASWAALRGAVWQMRPFGEPQNQLSGRSRAQLLLGRARSILRPPIHARARGAAAWDAIRGSLGLPVGLHRPHGGAPVGLRSRPRAPRALASRVACCRPPATAYEHAFRQRPVLPRSFIPTRSRTHPPTVEFFPLFPPARDAGGCPPPLPCYRCEYPALSAGVARRRPSLPPPLLPLSFFRPCRRRGMLAAVPPLPLCWFLPSPVTRVWVFAHVRRRCCVVAGGVP